MFLTAERFCKSDRFALSKMQYRTYHVIPFILQLLAHISEQTHPTLQGPVVFFLHH